MIETFLKSCPFAIAHLSANGTFLNASPPFPAMLGMEMSEFIGTSCQDITHPDDLLAHANRHQELLDGKIGTYSTRKRYWHKSGHWFWVLFEAGLDSNTGNAWVYVTEIDSLLPKFRTADLFQSVLDDLRSGGMCLHYQPIVDLSSRKTVAYEALVRWYRGGILVPPDDWLPQLDETIFPEVCLWVFNKICEDRKNWAGPEDIAFAANISPVSLKVEGFIDQLLAIPERIGYGSDRDRKNIWLEITEQSVIGVHALNVMKIIKESGHKAVIDDFGVGYSNLIALSHYGADVIKIDKTITSELPSRSSVQIINMLVSLAGVLNFRTVAEGIEDPDLARLVQALGVDYGQGWLFGKPIPIEDIRHEAID